MSEVTKQPFFFSFLAEDLSSKWRFTLLCASNELQQSIERQFVDFDATALEPYFSKSRIETYRGDKNVLMVNLAAISEDENAVGIVLSDDRQDVKAIFDHLQLRQNPFSMASFNSALGGDRDPTMTMHDLAHPNMTDQAILGLQRHLMKVDLDQVPHNLRLLNLSAMQDRPKQIEPIVRRADVVNFHLACAKNPTNPIGIGSQQLAQASHYAGRGTKTKFLSITGIEIQNGFAVASTAAIVWYYLFGMTFRRPLDIAAMRQYTVESSVEGRQLTFLHDDVTQHWWCSSSELPEAEGLLPCDYDDYRQAAEHSELSENLRYLLAIHS